MRVLILRTFMHHRVWETERDLCTFESTQWQDLISKWEPAYLELSIEDIPIALGIYSRKYFEPYPTRHRDKPVYSGTQEEENISILKLTGSEDSKSLARVSKDFLVVNYDFVEKLFIHPDKDLMIRIDELLLSAKESELSNKYGSIPNTEYPPLSFTLEWSVVKEVIDNEILNLDWLEKYS